MGVDDWLWQQQRLIDMVDPPALRAIREVQEKNSWLQAQESIVDTFSRSGLQDSLTNTSPFHIVSEGMSPILGGLENTLRSGEVSWAASVAEATRGLVENYESLKSLQPDRAMDEFLRQTDWLRKVQRANFPPVTAFSSQLYFVAQHIG